MSTQKVLLINEAQVKSQSIIEKDVDSSLLSKTIKNVQETQLKPILGSDLYDSTLNAVYELQTNSTALPEATKTLLDDYIQPYLIYATLCDFIIVNNFKVTNKGLMKMNDNNATSASTQDLEYVKHYYDNYLTTYKDKLINYLKDSKQLENDADTNITANAIGWYLD